ncbi:MAG: S41 family peptidase [Armatimonadota bacterium]
MKSLTSAGIIVGLLVSTIAGLNVREKRDMPETASSGLMASKDEQFDIAEADYYVGISGLLKDKYVDPITDDKKLLSGAVRGMIVGLADINSQFFNPNEFTAYKNARAGQYHGVGVWLDFKSIKTDIKPTPGEADLSLPRLAVVSVALGSAADKAGVKVGDLVTEVDDHWVLNSEEILRFRKAQQDFFAKKIDFKTINDMRKDIKAKLEKSVTPVRAKERLISGEKGTMHVKFDRNGTVVDTRLAKGVYDVPGLKEVNGAFVLTFTSGEVDALKSYVSGKTQITIDLRNNVLGDYETMRKCLSVVAPASTYGYFSNEKKATPVIFKTDTGNSKPPKIKLIVDPSTRDAAEIFALSLSSKGFATLSGSEMGNSRRHHDICQLPDGSGYTLTTGLFRTGAPQNVPTGKGGEK